MKKGDEINLSALAFKSKVEIRHKKILEDVGGGGWAPTDMHTCLDVRPLNDLGKNLLIILLIQCRKKESLDWMMKNGFTSIY